MSDEKPVQTPTGFTEDTTTPEIFADVPVGFHLLNGVVKVTLGSIRYEMTSRSMKRVVVGRLVTTVPAARELATGLMKFLESQGIDVSKDIAPATTKSAKGTRKAN